MPLSSWGDRKFRCLIFFSCGDDDFFPTCQVTYCFCFQSTNIFNTIFYLKQMHRKSYTNTFNTNWYMTFCQFASGRIYWLSTKLTLNTQKFCRTTEKIWKASSRRNRTTIYHIDISAISFS